MNNRRIVTIDGLAASGKSTLARLLTEKTNAITLSTGEMHRINAFLIQERKINYNDDTLLKDYIQSINIEYFEKDQHIRFAIDGVDIREVNKSDLKSEILSSITRKPFVCEYFTEIFRKIESNNIVITEGHGVGSGIFPNAFIKFFCNAPETIRAQRRAMQKNEEYRIVMEEIHTRDLWDQKREVNPVKLVDDMIVIDTYKMDIKTCLSIMLGEIKNSIGEKNV